MWCPVCKNEYREGITVCVDCNVPLVEELTDPKEHEIVELVSTEKKDLLYKFAEYLEYSGITAYTITPDKYELVWTMSVEAKDLAPAKKLLKGFIIANNEMKEKEVSGNESNDELPDEISEEFESFYETEDEEEEENLVFNAHNSTYIKKSDRYTEYRFSAYTCFLVGIVGGVFCVLNILGIFSFVPALFSQIVLLVIFIAFLIGGVVMYSTSNKIKQGISEEESEENTINEWLTLNVTPEYINEIKDEDVSDEVNYFNYTEKINARLVEEFPDAPSDMIESLVDEHLTNIL